MDAALIATGRAPFTQGLGLENVCLSIFWVWNEKFCRSKWLYFCLTLFLQIGVVTQRGFVPVDERMRVTDANGNLVGIQPFNAQILICLWPFVTEISYLNDRSLIYIVLVMQMAKWCLLMLPVHKEYQVSNNSCNFAMSTRAFCSHFTKYRFSIVVEQVTGRDHVLNHLSIPAACFTHPEISMVGLTEVHMNFICCAQHQNWLTSLLCEFDTLLPHALLPFSLIWVMQNIYAP